MTEKRKHCPFRFDRLLQPECIGEHCAIWDEDSGKCSLRSTARNTDITIQCVESMERELRQK